MTRSPFHLENPTICGGFTFELDGDEPIFTILPGQRTLLSSLAEAVLRGLDQAPKRFAEALRLQPVSRPYQRVEVALRAGKHAAGEALGFASGCIRLSLGEEASVAEVEGLALHEALHLFLCANLTGGEHWNHSEVAFPDWIVRGIESFGDPLLARFRTPLPQIFEPLPTSRRAVVEQLDFLASNADQQRRFLGDELHAALTRLAGQEQNLDVEALRRRRLWLVEAAFGSHYLESAQRLRGDHPSALLAVLLDDWLLDYQQYASAVGSQPSGAGSLWRLADAAWSREPLVRLALAAQHAQLADSCWFSSSRSAAPGEPLVWRKRGRVRLPLLAPSDGAQPEPLARFREALRDVEASKEVVEALQALEEAARGAAGFEARALWPRLLARLCAAKFPAPEAAPDELPLVIFVDGPRAADAFADWSATLAALKKLIGPHAAWLPRLIPPQRILALAQSPRERASITLVYSEAADAARLLELQKLAAHQPIRGALFPAIDRDSLYEQLPDPPPPLDPRYREALWSPADPPPAKLEELPAAVDRATANGELSSSLSHLLSISSPGLDECHYPPPGK